MELLISDIAPPSRATRRTALRWAVITAAILLFLYLARLAFILAFADEFAGAPSAALPRIPASAHVLSEGQTCASGGCWWEVRVEPSDGQLPSELAQELDVQSEQCVPGNLWDPRPECIGSREQSGILVIYASRRSLVWG